MRKWWAFVRTYTYSGTRKQPNGYIKVTVEAPDHWTAINMLKSQYGADLISEAAPMN